MTPKMIKYVVDEYSSAEGGYVVRIEGRSYREAIFVEEAAAIDFAHYRTQMLRKYDTNAVETYRTPTGRLKKPK